MCLMQLGEYPVVTKSYDHEFLKSNSVTSFSQNNAVENYRKYQKKQGSTIIMAWSLSWGPFLESPVNFSGPKSNIQIEI